MFRRVIHAWPDKQRFNELWGVRAAALVVVEWNEADGAEWIDDAAPDLLLPGATVPAPLTPPKTLPQLPIDVTAILESTARWAAGYSSGLK